MCQSWLIFMVRLLWLVYRKFRTSRKTKACTKPDTIIIIMQHQIMSLRLWCFVNHSDLYLRMCEVSSVRYPSSLYILLPSEKLLHLQTFLPWIIRKGRSERHTRSWVSYFVVKFQASLPRLQSSALSAFIFISVTTFWIYTSTMSPSHLLLFLLQPNGVVLARWWSQF